MRSWKPITGGMRHPDSRWNRPSSCGRLLVKEDVLLTAGRPFLLVRSPGLFRTRHDGDRLREKRSAKGTRPCRVCFLGNDHCPLSGPSGMKNGMMPF